MDYNEVRQRRKMNNGEMGSNSPKKNGNIKYIIIIALAIIILAVVMVVFAKNVMPKKNDNAYTVQVTETPEEIIPTIEPTTEITLEPTLEPISNMGTKESIPQDVWEYMNGRSWEENPNVGYDDLMYLTIPYYNYDYQITTGHMVVAADVADDVLNIFSELFDIQYPIEHMEPIDAYFANLTEQFDTPDRNSMGNNNTSCFYYRVVSGSGNLSNHAYGRAIDLNPKTNPWVGKSGTVSPRNAVMYGQRAESKAETDFTGWSDVEQAAFIGNDTEVYNIFRKYGWQWGGEIWEEKDYQHFQKSR